MLTTAELGDVGEDTEYPIEVTLDQIAELFYRVNDAWFTGGSISIATGDPLVEPTFSASLTAPTDAPADRTAYSGSLTRGFTTRTIDGAATISTHNAAYLAAEYDAGSGLMCRDIGDGERGIWMRGEVNVTLPYWDFDSGNSETMNAFSCGFEGGGSIGLPDTFAVTSFFDLDPPTYVADAEAYVKFSGNVAVIREDPLHDICAPTNRYFVELDFFVKDASENFGIFEVASRSALLSGTGSKVQRNSGDPNFVQYVIRLSSGDVSCPVFVYYGDDTTYPYEYGEDFIHEAQYWWPYAKGSPAAPVWDADSGALL